MNQKDLLSVVSCGRFVDEKEDFQFCFCTFLYSFKVRTRFMCLCVCVYTKIYGIWDMVGHFVFLLSFTSLCWGEEGRSNRIMIYFE